MEYLIKIEFMFCENLVSILFSPLMYTMGSSRNVIQIILFDCGWYFFTRDITLKIASCEGCPNAYIFVSGIFLKLMAPRILISEGSDSVNHWSDFSNVLYKYSVRRCGRKFWSILRSQHNPSTILSRCCYLVFRVVGETKTYFHNMGGPLITENLTASYRNIIFGTNFKHAAFKFSLS